MDEMAIQTPFSIKHKKITRLPRGKKLKDCIAGFKFVIFEPVKNVWYKNGDQNYTIEFQMNLDKMKLSQIKLKSGYKLPFYVKDVINWEPNLLLFWNYKKNGI